MNWLHLCSGFFIFLKITVLKYRAQLSPCIRMETCIHTSMTLLSSCCDFIMIPFRVSCDFPPLTAISDELRVISGVIVNLSQEKSWWKKSNRSWAPTWYGVHPREFVFRRNHSLSLVILDYELTRVNSIPYGHPWWILYFLLDSYVLLTHEVQVHFDGTGNTAWRRD